MTDRDRIEEAFLEAIAPQRSPAMALCGVMQALGFDFGDPTTVEHHVMQFYADPQVNPFVQAQIEAKIVLDAGEIEKLTQWVKHTNADEPKWLRSFQTNAAAAISSAAAEDEVSAENLLMNMARTLTDVIRIGIVKFGAPVFNKAIGAAVDRIIEDKNEHF